MQSVVFMSLITGNTNTSLPLLTQGSNQLLLCFLTALIKTLGEMPIPHIYELAWLEQGANSHGCGFIPHMGHSELDSMILVRCLQLRTFCGSSYSIVVVQWAKLLNTIIATLKSGG